MWSWGIRILPNRGIRSVFELEDTIRFFKLAPSTQAKVKRNNTRFCHLGQGSLILEATEYASVANSTHGFAASCRTMTCSSLSSKRSTNVGKATDSIRQTQFRGEGGHFYWRNHDKGPNMLRRFVDFEVQKLPSCVETLRRKVAPSITPR